MGAKEEEAAKGPLSTAGVIAAWFALNIAMGSSTKWLYIHGVVCKTRTINPLRPFSGLDSDEMFPEPDGISEVCTHYRFPLAITVLHMAFSWATCYVWLHHFRGVPAGSGLSFEKQRKTIAPLAVVFAGSVAMGNLSLKYIFPSFNQMLGSMSPLITVLMAVAVEGKRFNQWTWLSMPVLCGGLALCSVAEVNFDLVGALFCAGATILRGLKSIMQGAIMSGKEDKLDAVTLLYYMAPWAAAVLLVLGVFVEGLEPWTVLLGGLLVDPTGGSSVQGVSKLVVLLCLSGLNACLLNVFNFLVTHYTSAVAQQVLGNVKSCLAIATSVAIFGNELKLEQAIGIGTCLFGVWMYQQWGGPVKSPSSAIVAFDDELKDPVDMIPLTSQTTTMGTQERP